MRIPTSGTAHLADATQVSAGDTAWVLICAALVLFMTPGLALFYAGMVSRRNTLVMLQQNIVPIGVISITWVVIGYSLAFGADHGGVTGDLELFGLTDLGETPANPRHVVDAASGMAIPTLAFVAYQMMFAIITPALATGAVASRLKAFGWIVFLAAWSIVVYPPIAHWLWSPDGWLTQMGAQDWAGGMVVHASAGAAVLALLIVLGRRRVWPDRAPLPHSIPLVVLGAGILWFGWFGFNAGDGLRADGVAAQALINTHVAGAAAMMVWLLMEWIKTRRATVLGGVTGAVAGLATITPGAGYVSTFGALAIGVLAALVCHLALKLKDVFRFDDALDVIAVHFIGGVIGTLLVGFFGTEAVNAAGKDGVFYGGGAALLGHQAVALVAVIAYSFVLTLVIAYVIQWTIGLRVRPEDEGRLDQVQQGADAYSDEPPAAVAAATARGAAVTEAGDGEAADSAVDALLMTAVLTGETTDGGELRRALLDAGATSVLLSLAHGLGTESDQVTVRSATRQVDSPARSRLDVVAPSDVADRVLRVLRTTPGISDLYTQKVQQTVLR